jgi:hypothetical protein
VRKSAVPLARAAGWHALRYSEGRAGVPTDVTPLQLAYGEDTLSSMRIVDPATG